jgi:predicted nucleic acid-binding protein
LGCFADSSAVVKLYSVEEGSEEVAALSAIVVSALARVEVPAAIWRKSREGGLTAGEAALLVRKFESDITAVGGAPPRLTMVSVGSQLLAAAASLLGIHPLRAYDAVQLATAMAVQGVDPSFRGFVCFDTALRGAAETQGLAVIPTA